MRCDPGSDRADRRVQARCQDRRPGADVSERYFHRRRQPDRRPRDVDSLRLRPQRPADRTADSGQLFRGSADPQCRASIPAGNRLAQARARSHCAGDGAMSWEVVIGLETHAQLSTASKIFSGASTAFGAPPNTQASAVDLALPGTLPVLNKGAVERAIRFGLAVGGTIAPLSAFERKNYFY